MQVVKKKKRVSIFKHVSHSWIFTHHKKDRIQPMFLGKAWHAGERRKARQHLPPSQFEESGQPSPRGAYLPQFIMCREPLYSLGISEFAPKSDNATFLSQQQRGHKRQASRAQPIWTGRGVPMRAVSLPWRRVAVPLYVRPRDCSPRV